MDTDAVLRWYCHLVGRGQKFKKQIRLGRWSGLRRQRQVGLYEFKDSLIYIDFQGRWSYIVERLCFKKAVEYKAGSAG